MRLFAEASPSAEDLSFSAVSAVLCEPLSLLLLVRLVMLPITRSTLTFRFALD